MASQTSRGDPLPPYLGSWAIASLAFTSPIVLSLILVALRLILAIDSANSSVEQAKQSLTSSCLALEQSASSAASFPHYLAGNVNNATAEAAEAMVQGLGTVLDMSILGIEKLVIFMLDTYRSLYLCLADFVVRGALNLGVEASQEFSAFLQTTFTTVRGEVQDAISGASGLLSDVVSGLNRLPGVNIDPPSIATPSLDFLNNVQLPSGFLTSLQRLNGSLPTLNEMQAKLDSFVAVPFEELRKEINSTLKNATLDRNILPVPSKEALTFCQDLDVSFVDRVGADLVKVAKYGIIAISLMIATFIGLMVMKERFTFRAVAEYVDLTRQGWHYDEDVDVHQHTHTAERHSRYLDTDGVVSRTALLGFATAVFNPFLRFLPRVFKRIPPVRKSARAQSNMTWFVAYITYLPAILLLLVGLTGLISVEIQLAALKPIESKAQVQVNEGLSRLKATALAKINSVTADKSMQFANDSNTAINLLETNVNENLFGWVNTTTVTLNTSIVEFYTDLTGAINSTFGSTPLAAPALQLIACLIGNKIVSLSDALTWLHENAHLTLPRVRNNVFTLSAAASHELVGSLDDPQATSGPPSIVTTLLQQYRAALEKERWIFVFIIGLYLLVVLFGVIAVLSHEYLLPTPRSRKAGVQASAGEFIEKADGFDVKSGQGQGKFRKFGLLSMVTAIPSRMGAGRAAEVEERQSIERSTHTVLPASAMYNNGSTMAQRSSSRLLTSSALFPLRQNPFASPFDGVREG